MIDEVRLSTLEATAGPPPSHEGMIIARDTRSLHKNLASTMRTAHAAFSHIAII
jgi:hypothetical protein